MTDTAKPHLADHVLGVELHPLVPKGAWAATTEFKLNLPAADA